jgi:hypothetical protein
MKPRGMVCHDSALELVHCRGSGTLIEEMFYSVQLVIINHMEERVTLYRIVRPAVDISRVGFQGHKNDIALLKMWAQMRRDCPRAR